MTMKAKYENGMFRPLEDALIEEGTVVEAGVSVQVPNVKRRSIGDSPFAGIWKARDDMADSIDYVNCLRYDLHG